ncbi:hypothetical protein [Williamsia sp.]|uniref:hypothetical protein n=1 Tax=Williamsia sp. TaxID=1872085 RepID=UPI002F95CB1F
MQIQNDDDGSDAAFTAALQDVVDEGEEFGTAGCAQQAQLDAACGISALNVDTSFDIVAVRLGIL